MRRKPDGRGRQGLSWNVDGALTDVFSRAELDFLEGHGLPGDVHVAVGQEGIGDVSAFVALRLDGHAAFQHRLGVVVHLVPLDVGYLALEIEFADEIRFAVVQINGLGIDQFRRADGVDVGDDFVLGSRFSAVPAPPSGGARQSKTYCRSCAEG